MDESPIEIIKKVITTCRKAYLSTIMYGWPYNSLVQFSVGEHNSITFMLSDLAQHSKNLKTNSKASLLFDGTVGYKNPLSGPRVTFLGEIFETESESDKENYLKFHPEAEEFLNLGDFRFYKFEISKVLLVAGFGQIHWIEPKNLLLTL